MLVQHTSVLCCKQMITAWQKLKEWSIEKIQILPWAADGFSA
jgi:hypothetical protein